MSNGNTDLVTAEALTNLQALVRKAMDAAHAQVIAQRAETAARIEAQHLAAVAGSSERATAIITNIPAHVQEGTRRRLESSSSPRDAFDCRAAIMRLTYLESTEGAGSDEDSSWNSKQPNPACIRYAARLVWDFCQRANLNPQLERSTYAEGHSCEYTGCFNIVIRWNLPAEMKAAA